MNEEEEVRPFLLCESCTYTEGKLGMLFSWVELVEHMRTNHWIRVRHAPNGQSVYQCSECQHPFQLSFQPVVDFAGNLFCGYACVKDSYLQRLTTSDALAVLAQEKRDEEYALKSLKGEL